MLIILNDFVGPSPNLDHDPEKILLKKLGSIYFKKYLYCISNRFPKVYLYNKKLMILKLIIDYIL